ncbi:hypothetical protein [Marinicella litoralis]|uniref:Uncharacterized protein n=1 Tax=Marinicella litoralis TaxID=644220 RepID=A0A4V3DIN4_9GAMM|nr:hypothetical protein [Marinicella litoralis]TDR22741.1 hypothetical protein C8D91_1234 [Marinicella litoralis]
MTWQLTLINNHRQSNECCLKMTQLKRNRILRQWFGPMAWQLFKSVTGDKTTPVCHNEKVLLDKQTAQSFLIEASFFHQKCLQLYQINSDLKSKGLVPSQELCELLLYLRMTTQHPSHQIISLLADCHFPCNLSFDRALKALLNAQLIQKIVCLPFIFYDKNPYPHDHVFDQTSQSLTDHDNIKIIHDHQMIIQHHAEPCL